VRRGVSILLAGAIVAVVTIGLCSSAAAAAPTARLLPDGRAVAPPSAPPSVKAMIEAANRIRHRPYVWGGGHRSWNSRGYDCSGSVSYVLHAAGMLDWPLDSTGFMRWGGGGAAAGCGSTPTRNMPSR
jgi:cell wall-associated NlpC family hydrolase